MPVVYCPRAVCPGTVGAGTKQRVRLSEQSDVGCELWQEEQGGKEGGGGEREEGEGGGGEREGVLGKTPAYFNE